jgi:hypothetical protein
MPASAFSRWLDDFFTSYFRLWPVNATFIGMHSYDAELPDLSEAGMAATVGDAEALLQGLGDLPLEPLTHAEEIDRRLAEGFLLIQRWESESAHFGPKNPSLFTGEAIFGIVSLLLRPYAPLEDRLGSAAARLNGIPAFLDVHRLRAAPLAWIERARRECIGAQLLLEDVGVEYPQLQRVAAGAADAFARFDAFLGTDLQATDEYACGPDAFDLLLRHGHFLDMDADGLERLALARIAEEETALSSVTPPHHPPSPRVRGGLISRASPRSGTVRATSPSGMTC